MFGDVGIKCIYGVEDIRTLCECIKISFEWNIIIIVKTYQYLHLLFDIFII